MIYKGIAGADGIGIGQVLIIKEASLDYSHVQFSGKEQEKKRLHDAIATFCQKTEALREKVEKTSGKNRRKF